MSPVEGMDTPRWFMTKKGKAFCGGSFYYSYFKKRETGVEL